MNGYLIARFFLLRNLLGVAGAVLLIFGFVMWLFTSLEAEIMEDKVQKSIRGKFGRCLIVGAFLLLLYVLLPGPF